MGLTIEDVKGAITNRKDEIYFTGVFESEKLVKQAVNFLRTSPYKTSIIEDEDSGIQVTAQRLESGIITRHRNREHSVLVVSADKKYHMLEGIFDFINLGIYDNENKIASGNVCIEPQEIISIKSSNEMSEFDDQVRKAKKQGTNVVNVDIKKLYDTTFEEINKNFEVVVIGPDVKEFAKKLLEKEKDDIPKDTPKAVLEELENKIAAMIAEGREEAVQRVIKEKIERLSIVNRLLYRGIGPIAHFVVLGTLPQNEVK